MSNPEELLELAQAWATQRGRTFAPELVDTAIRLRDSYDGLEAHRWPARTVEHLMLVRWPSHGPHGVPDVAALVASLDTFWRFLRSTGRMAGGSAEPAALAQEARKAGKRMAAACTDDRNFGSNKILLGFGAEIGVTLDDATSIEEVQERFQRITDAWNALPIDERRRRTPGLDALEAEAGAEGVDDGYEWTADLSDPATSAPHVRASEFVASLRALVDWVGTGREVTSTGALRPVIARAAVDALGLGDWDRSWRSAMDCLPLHRLWLAAVGTELVELRATKAVAHPEAWPTTDREWVAFGLTAVHELYDLATYEGIEYPLTELLFEIDGRQGAPKKRAAVADWWWQSPGNPLAGPEHDAVMRPISDDTLAGCLEFFGDLGLWTERAGYLIGTDFGWDCAVYLAATHSPDGQDFEG